MPDKLLEKIGIEMALAPDADRYNGNPSTDVFSLALYDNIAFIVDEGAGGTGTAKFEVWACDNLAGDNPEAIAFHVRTKAVDGEWTERTAVASTGYTSVAGANKLIGIEVDAAALPAGKPCVYVEVTEVANDPVDAGIIAILGGARYMEAAMPSATAA